MYALNLWSGYELRQASHSCHQKGSLSGPVQMNSLAFLLGGRHLGVADRPYTGTRRDGLEDARVTWLMLYIAICIYEGYVLQHEYH